MGHSAKGRDAVCAPGQSVTGACESDHVAEAREPVRSLSPVSPAGGEVDNGLALSGVDYSGSLGREHSLEVDLVDQERLEKLRLDYGGGHLEHGLSGEGDGALVHRPHAPGEPKLLQIREEVAVEALSSPKVRNVAARESESFEVLQDIGQAGKHKVGAVGRVRPEEEAEGGVGRHSALPVGLSHRQLVEVGEQGRGELFSTHMRPQVQNLICVGSIYLAGPGSQKIRADHS